MDLIVKQDGDGQIRLRFNISETKHATKNLRINKEYL